MVSLQNDSAIGAIDAALAAEAAGLVEFEDLGHLSLAEIDSLIDCLINLKRQQHFSPTGATRIKPLPIWFAAGPASKAGGRPP